MIDVWLMEISAIDNICLQHALLAYCRFGIFLFSLALIISFRFFYIFYKASSAHLAFYNLQS